MNPQAFIFIGRSGSGKGTQRELLEKYLKNLDSGRDIITIETGEMFRDFIKGDKYVQKLSNEAYKAGVRQPDFLAAYMWAESLIDVYTEGTHLVFDGTPRSKNEAFMLETALKFLQFMKPTIVYLNVSDEWSHQRLESRGRQDDLSREKNEKRLAWFAADVIPAIEYYKSEPYYDFLDINGEQPIEAVHEEIISKLKI